MNPPRRDPVVHIVVTFFQREEANVKGVSGELEQMVLLGILQMGDGAFGLEIRREIERNAERSVSRGAFYTTLDRMEK